MLSAYSQIWLPKELRNYTAFSFRGKCYRYKVLPYGASIAFAVLTTYLGLNVEIARASYLLKLIPKCVRMDDLHWDKAEDHYDHVKAMRLNPFHQEWLLQRKLLLGPASLQLLNLFRDLDVVVLDNRRYWLPLSTVRKNG